MTAIQDPASNTSVLATGTAGGGHSVALRSDGSLIAWGHNTHGQCEVPLGNDFVAIEAIGGYHSLAVKSDGSVAAWGWDNHGQCAIPSGYDFTTIAAGGYHSFAVVPEPATLLVFGLGALIVCKKR